ncbi:MAG: Rieske 2Fe-2S domain-containing protein [Alphaproteobacteria bacterium]|nr:Rieske 2Fe-2S domain-containing protein [Alphaproteobacteria bacterium]
MAQGPCKRIELAGRAIAIFNLGGEFFALNDRCPHEGGSLCKGKISALTVSSQPGEYNWTREGEFIRCPWHGWEFDIRTGRSVCDPRTMRTRLYDAHVEHGGDVIEGLAAGKLLAAESYRVSVEDDYIIVEI